MGFCANLVKTPGQTCEMSGEKSFRMVSNYTFLVWLFISTFYFLATCGVSKPKKCLQRTLFSLSIFLLFYFLTMHSAKSSSNLKRNSVSFFTSQNKRKKVIVDREVDFFVFSSCNCANLSISPLCGSERRKHVRLQCFRCKETVRTRDAKSRRRDEPLDCRFLDS